MFGDKSVAAIASEAVRETAKIYHLIDKDAAQKLIDNTYVDSDTGADLTEDIAKLQKNILRIMEKGSFKVKDFVASGDQSAIHEPTNLVCRKFPILQEISYVIEKSLIISKISIFS